MVELELASRKLEALQRQGLGKGHGSGLIATSSASKDNSRDGSGTGTGNASSSGSSVSSFRSTSNYRATIPAGSSVQGALKSLLLVTIGDGDEDDDGISPRTVTSAITATSPHSHRSQVIPTPLPL